MRMPDWVKRDAREPTSLAGRAAMPDGRIVDVNITNLSNIGCRVECDEMLPIGQTIRLQACGISFNAEVRWALPGCAGLRMTFAAIPT